MPSLAPSQAKSFTFDHVFDTASTQDEVYIECVKPLVDRFLEGFNATVLAYGQVRTMVEICYGFSCASDVKAILG